MLPKENRLPSFLIPEILKKGKRIYSSFFVLVTSGQLPAASHRLQVTSYKPPRFAFIVSSKVEKKAVKRNRLKRQLREIIKNDLAKIKAGQDAVLITKKNTFNQTYESLKIEWQKTLSNLCLQKSAVKKNSAKDVRR